MPAIIPPRFTLCESVDEQKSFIRGLFGMVYTASGPNTFQFEGIYFNEKWEQLPLREQFQILSFIYNNETFDLTVGFSEDNPTIGLSEFALSINTYFCCFSRKTFLSKVQSLMNSIYTTYDPETTNKFWYLAATNSNFASAIPHQEELIKAPTNILAKMLNNGALSLFNGEKLIHVAARFLNVEYIGVLFELIDELQLKEEFTGHIKEAFEIISNNKSPEAQDVLARFKASLKEHKMEDIIEPAKKPSNPNINRDKRTRCLTM